METNVMDIESNPAVELVRNAFSCLTCSIVLNEKEIRDDHYKSEWHRYNLHRKLANLPSITLDKFETRSTANEKAENQKKRINCDICQKKFTNDKQCNNHFMSKKHKEKMKNVNTKNQISEIVNTKTGMDVVADVTDIDSDYENPIELNDCLFCDHHSKNVKRNLKHMMIQHSFFVPDPEYCIDEKGLLMSLANKIYQDYQCIWCNDSGKQIIIFI
jgi:pre-60S factor REI1